MARGQASVPEIYSRKRKTRNVSGPLTAASTKSAFAFTIIRHPYERYKDGTRHVEPSLQIQQHLVNCVTCHRIHVFCFIFYFDHVRVKTSQAGQRIHCIFSYFVIEMFMIHSHRFGIIALYQLCYERL